MSTPKEILETTFKRAVFDLLKPAVSDQKVVNQVELVVRNERNRAGARLLLACALAKVHKPEIDIRKPYDKLGENAYSGRAYDENFITTFITQHKLPCNSTTAFLTPALRAKNIVLTQEVDLDGNPPIVYRTFLALLAEVADNKISAENLLIETIRWLIIVREENQKRLSDLLTALRTNQIEEALPLSSEAIVNLIGQHLACPQSSRLPVLIVTAAYQAALELLKEKALPLQAHNAADEQTGALGDLEITLLNESKVITCYEMKMKRITIDDINRALQKIGSLEMKIDNYIFITTDEIEASVKSYADSLYATTAGVEVAILDCLGFLCNFLHLFHRSRVRFLDGYQELVLAEPESAVRQSLKESFLTLRRAAETGTTEASE